MILTSDAGYCSDNYNEMRVPGVVLDSVGWAKSCRRIKKLARESRAQVWFGHDMAQFRTLKTAPQFYYDREAKFDRSGVLPLGSGHTFNIRRS